ncbi:DnaJ-domain-containing protein [Trematosphaeria pertusa]|uniref:DnaJ-domain-containing protein n=1 Tax=Trematosphaeria pertusa TaxID=390896 RepID=A0A6A6J0E3_9PLEO|nr:DnaJ-domain-containing protein [Trematosphaeria pertusa]KAF2256169.1 DnaJ-domain-containing protein [Trematosphaeria pertusa]
MATHYDILGVAVSADVADIRKAYHTVALANHPDKTHHLPPGERAVREKAFKDANNAWEVLSEPLKRQAYDAALRRPRGWGTIPDTRERTPTPAPTFFKTRRGRRYRARAPSPPSPPSSPPPLQSRKVPAFSSSSDMNSFARGPWFQCPVFDDGSSTTVNYANSTGWAFSIGLSKRFELIEPPRLPDLGKDTSTTIAITLKMRRGTPGAAKAFTKQVQVCMDRTPKAREVVMASLLKDEGGIIELTITFSPSVNIEVTVSPFTTSQPWRLAFDADHTSLAPEQRQFAATNLIFYPNYPAHTMSGGETSTTTHGYAAGSPMAELAEQYPGIEILITSDHYYCRRVEGERKMFWQLAAIGYIPSHTSMA